MNFSLKRITQEFRNIKREIQQNSSENGDILKMHNLWGLNAISKRGLFDVVVECENLSLYYLKVTYTRHESYAFRFFRNEGLIRLPNEINSYIADFLKPNYVTLTLKMEHKEGYPFNGILWSVIDFENRMNMSNLRKYYEDQVAEYNCEIANGWSPVITLGKNILTLFCKINNFDDVLD